MSLDMFVTGDTDVIKNLAGLSKAVTKRLVERAGRAALKPMVATARKGVPNEGGSISIGNGSKRGAGGRFLKTTTEAKWQNSGQLKKSIGIKKAKRFKGGVLLMVGPRPGFAWTDDKGRKHDPMRYGIPVEYGHTFPNGTFVPPAGFLRNAYNVHRVSAVEVFATELRDRIDTYMARGA